jgi:hypothetical protein
MDEKTPKASKIEYPPPEETQLAVFDLDVQFVYANGFLVNVNASDGEMVIAVGVKQPGVKVADDTIKTGRIKFTHRIHLPLQVGMQVRDVLNQVFASMEKMHPKITTEGSTAKN